MTLQSSGPIKISDIKTELGSSSNSLDSLSIQAGKGAPDSMSEFYGYTFSKIPDAPTNVQISSEHDDLGTLDGFWDFPPAYVTQVIVKWFVQNTLKATHTLGPTNSDQYQWGLPSPPNCRIDVAFVSAQGQGPFASSPTIQG